jgi:hypothetical protein
MLISRRATRWIARLLMGALLVSQLAAAAHACAMLGADPAMGHPSIAQSALDTEQGADDPMALAECMGHCQSSAQHVDEKPMPVSPMAPAMGKHWMAAWEPIEPAVPPHRRDSVLDHPREPSHAILHCCMRC